MASECKVKIVATVEGLGTPVELGLMFTTATPTKITHGYAILDTANTGQALDLGDIENSNFPTDDFVELIIIKAVSKAVYVDTTYVSSMSNEIIIPEGKVQIFKPVGTVYWKNVTAGETPTIEYWVIAKNTET